MGCLWALCAGRPHLVGWKCEDTSSCFPIKQLMGIGIYLSVTLGNLSWLSLWTPNWCPTYQIYSPSFKCSPSSGPYTWLFCGIVERILRSLKLYIYFSVVTWDFWVNRWCHSDVMTTTCCIQFHSSENVSGEITIQQQCWMSDWVIINSTSLNMTKQCIWALVMLSYVHIWELCR